MPCELHVQRMVVIQVRGVGGGPGESGICKGVHVYVHTVPSMELK